MEEEKKIIFKFLTAEEGFTWNGTKDVDDFVAIRAPLPQKDGFQESLTPKILSVLWFFKRTVPRWYRKMVISCCP